MDMGITKEKKFEEGKAQNRTVYADLECQHNSSRTKNNNNHTWLELNNMDSISRLWYHFLEIVLIK